VTETPPQQNDAALLRDARTRAEKLLADLIARRDELDRHPLDRNIDHQTFTRGRAAFADAIASARRTLDAIDQALKTI
jgi:hypothetical protein